MSLTAPAIEKMHQQLREYYRMNGMDKSLPGDTDWVSQYGIREGYYDHSISPAPVGVIQVNRKAETKMIPKTTLAPRALEGVHFTAGLRIGDETKDRYLEWLREAYAKGYIGPAEHAARQDHVMKAETEAQLDVLVHDLPQLLKATPPHPPEGKQITGEPVLVRDVSVFILSVMAVVFPFMSGAATLAGGHEMIAVTLAFFAGVASILLMMLTRKKT